MNLRVKFLSVLGIGVLMFSAVQARIVESDNNSSKAIYVTPSAPQFSDAERQAELARRRNETAQRIGTGSIAVFFSATPRIYSNDVDFYYRQENNLFYLTNLKQQGAILVMMPGNANFSEILFLPKRDPRQEIWTGKMYRTEEAQKISGVREILDADEFQGFMNAVKVRQNFRSKSGKVFEIDKMKEPFASAEKSAAKLYLLLPTESDTREWEQEKQFAADWGKMPYGFKVESLQPIFDELRLVKSPFELKMLQHAIDITTEAQERAMATVGRLNWNIKCKPKSNTLFAAAMPIIGVIRQLSAAAKMPRRFIMKNRKAK